MTTLSKEDVVRAAFYKTFDPDDNGTHWHTFRDGYECGEQAARADLVAENERLESKAVILRATIKANEHWQEEAKKLRTALAAAEAREEKLRNKLEKIACLGNGDSHGNSIGNCMAIEALAQPRDDSALREMIAGVYEECEKACEHLTYPYSGHPLEEINDSWAKGTTDCADAILALAEKAQDKLTGETK